MDALVKEKKWSEARLRLKNASGMRELYRAMKSVHGVSLPSQLSSLAIA